MQARESILKRTSRRSYESQNLSEEHINFITGLLQISSKGPLGTEIEFNLISKFSEPNRKLKLGTYGFISGSRYFIVGQCLPGKTPNLDYGYQLEKIIIELSSIDLGTCWLGGTFDRSEFAKSISLREGNIIPAITPVGYPTEKRSIGDRVIRFGAGSKNRKEWESLFFDGSPTKPLNKTEIVGELAEALEMVRMAPSASNLQPWRFVKNGDSFNVYLQRKPGYMGRFGKTDLQMVDIGIAMSHFDLALSESGPKTEWKIKDDNIESFDGWEYIISVSIKDD